MSSNVYLLPGWQNSGPMHWQTLWAREHGYQWVDQHEWMRPKRGDWIARLEEVLLKVDEPVTLVAHSLGCHLVAAWAAHSSNTNRVKSAMLVAPPDVEREDMRTVLPSWAPIVMQPLPFKSLFLASQNDPYNTMARSKSIASAWRSELVDCGKAGHINAESGFELWPAGHALLLQLQKSKK